MTKISYYREDSNGNIIEIHGVDYYTRLIDLSWSAIIDDKNEKLIAKSFDPCSGVTTTTTATK